MNIHVGKFIFFADLACILLICVYSTFQCGPGLVCQCWTIVDNLTVIDCSKQVVDICDICNGTDKTLNISQINAENTTQHMFIDETCFDGCDKVRLLNLRNNTISSIHENAFRATPRIQILNLERNNLRLYGDGDNSWLKWLVKVTDLRVKWNDAEKNTATEYPDLSNFTNIQYLSIDGLLNTNFGESYGAMTTLTAVDLSGIKHTTYCNMGQLTNDTFKHLPSTVKTLNLKYCNILNIYAGTFIGLRKLSLLDISNNRQLGFAPLRNLSYSLQFTEIDILRMSYLHVTFGLGTILHKRDICYLRNTTLREIDADGNKLQLLETNAVLLLPPTLQRVNINDNTFSFGLFLLQMACLSNLTTVQSDQQHLNHAPIRYINEPVGQASFIENTGDDCPFMSDEYLQNISKTIDFCHFFKNESITKENLLSAAFPRNLKTYTCVSCDIQSSLNKYPIFPVPEISFIDFSNNVLFRWEGPVGPFPNLIVANLSRNYCSYIGPDFFFYLTKLQVLILSNNFLGIPFRTDTNGYIFRRLTNLRHLDVSANQIQYLPSNIFQHLYSLEHLDISINGLDTFSIDATSMRNLTILNISSNALQNLPNKLTSQLEETSKRRQTPFQIDMGNNPITVKCDNEKFLEWMVKHKTSFVGFSEYNFTNSNQEKLTEAEFLVAVFNLKKQCRTYTLAIVLSTLGISVFLSVVIGGLVYKNRWKLRYFLYMNKRRFYGYRAMPNYEPIENYKYDAFISYAEDNMRFIIDKLIPVLERDDEYSLCIHQRDFRAGNAVTDNIVDAIQSSRKTLIILSQEYLKSRWCIYEFHMARMESIYSRDGKGCMVIVMLEHVPITDYMPLEMVQWIKQQSYIEYTADQQGEVVFWGKLKEAIHD